MLVVSGDEWARPSFEFCRKSDIAARADNSLNAVDLAKKRFQGLRICRSNLKQDCAFTGNSVDLFDLLEDIKFEKPARGDPVSRFNVNERQQRTAKLLAVQ